MLHDNFIKKIEQESPEFIAIMAILTPLNPYAEKGRKLLCIVNHIVDYYILRDLESDSDIKMPIVYFPLCDEWAQVLCEEFISLKMSLLWGDGTRTGLITSVSLTFLCLKAQIRKNKMRVQSNLGSNVMFQKL